VLLLFGEEFTFPSAKCLLSKSSEFTVTGRHLRIKPQRFESEEMTQVGSRPAPLNS
ncbi:hypothetical protein FQA47_022423, partial [Oryzias melastigma]